MVRKGESEGTFSECSRESFSPFTYSLLASSCATECRLVLRVLSALKAVGKSSSLDASTPVSNSYLWYVNRSRTETMKDGKEPVLPFTILQESIQTVFEISQGGDSALEIPALVQASFPALPRLIFWPDIAPTGRPLNGHLWRRLPPDLL